MWQLHARIEMWELLSDSRLQSSLPSRPDIRSFLEDLFLEQQVPSLTAEGGKLLAVLEYRSAQAYIPREPSAMVSEDNKFCHSIARVDDHEHL